MKALNDEFNGVVLALVAHYLPHGFDLTPHPHGVLHSIKGRVGEEWESPG